MLSFTQNRRLVVQCFGLTSTLLTSLVLSIFFSFAHSFVHFLFSPPTEEEQRKEKELINREAESRLVELVVSSSQPVRANHITWGDDTHRQQPHHPPAPPPPSLPPPQVPIAVIPMVPVVTATPSVPPLPLTTPIAAAATTLNGSPPAKNASSPPQQQQPASPHLLCVPQMKVETSPQLVGAKPSQSQPQVQIQYPTSISTNGSGSQHALVPHQTPPTFQLRPNGVTMEDLRGMEGKRRPGGSVYVYVCVLKLI